VISRCYIVSLVACPVCRIRRSHVSAVVPECFKDDNASRWKSEKFDPAHLKTSESIVTKIWVDDYIWDLYHCAEFHYETITQCLPKNMRTCALTRLVVCSSVALQPSPLHRFLQTIRPVMSLRARRCLCTFRIHFVLKKTEISGQFFTGYKISPQKALTHK